VVGVALCSSPVRLRAGASPGILVLGPLSPLKISTLGATL